MFRLGSDAMGNARVPPEVYENVVKFTDAGTWKHSWHWDRDKNYAWNPISIVGAKQMLRDLRCDGDMKDEIERTLGKIQERYALADTLREIIRRAELHEEADSHEESCRCEVCRKAGYVTD